MTASETGSVPTGNTYDKYASTNPIERRMMDGFFTALDGLVEDLRPRRILEVGVGEGHVSERLLSRFPDASIVGLDLPDHELASSWRAHGLSCMFADAGALPAPDDAFDLVLAIEVFEHFDDPTGALRELSRVCTADLVASVPFEPIWRIGNIARGRYLADLGNTPGHVNHWSRRGFARFVAGEFDVERVVSPLPWTMVRARVR